MRRPGSVHAPSLSVEGLSWGAGGRGQFLPASPRLPSSTWQVWERGIATQVDESGFQLPGPCCCRRRRRLAEGGSGGLASVPPLRPSPPAPRSLPHRPGHPLAAPYQNPPRSCRRPLPQAACAGHTAPRRAPAACRPPPLLCGSCCPGRPGAAALPPCRSTPTGGRHKRCQHAARGDETRAIRWNEEGRGCLGCPAMNTMCTRLVKVGWRSPTPPPFLFQTSPATLSCGRTLSDSPPNPGIIRASPSHSGPAGEGQGRTGGVLPKLAALGSPSDSLPAASTSAPTVPGFRATRAESVQRQPSRHHRRSSVSRRYGARRLRPAAAGQAGGGIRDIRALGEMSSHRVMRHT